MATSNPVIINLSEKKIATSFVFKLFRDNFSLKNSDEIFVPGFKEYYFFPENSPNYNELCENLIKHVYANLQIFNREDLAFMMNILAYEVTGFTKKYYQFKGLKNRDEQLTKIKESIELCCKRFHYLHRHAKNSYKSIYISDTNFQNYLLLANSYFQKLIIKTLSETTGPIKTFCIIRNPKESIVSLLKTEPESLIEANADIIKQRVSRYNQFKRLKTLLTNCNPLISSVLLLDFNYLVKDTTNAFNLLCNFLGLPNDSNLVVPDNPNPSKSLTEKHQNDLSKWIPFIDEQINQQIDASDYKRLSEEKFLVISLKK